LDAIIQGISGVTALIGLAGKITEAGSSMGKADLKLLAADMKLGLADAKLALVDAHERIQELEKKLEIKSKTVFENGYQYEIDDKGKKTGTIYCPNCEHEKSKMIPLIPPPSLGSYLTCPVCKQFKDDGNYGHGGNSSSY